jgi:hypothetical protein
MATLAEFRAQYPQYNEVPDVKLADSLHQKFYSTIPKMDFYKTIGIGASALIPGGEGRITGIPQPEVSMRDRIMGVIETPAALVGGLAGGIAAPIAGIYGQLTSPAPQGSPEAKAAGEAMAAKTRAQFYQPRTETARDILGAVGKVAEGLPPVLGGSLGTSLNALAVPAVRQTAAAVRPVVSQAVAPVRNALTRKQPDMVGMGAASTAEDLMRQQRLEQFGIRATAGERERNLQKQQFESEVQRGAITGISEDTKVALSEQMRRFEAGKKQDIVRNFERMTAETGAEVADPTQLRAVGKIVDKALNDEYTKKFDAYKALYAKADNAGETLQPVSYQSLLDYINTKTPTARGKLDPILDSVAESLAMNDPNKTGTITVRALEDIYQQIGKVKGSPSAPEMKQLITQMGEGAGGELYQAARASRKQLAKEFEDVSRVDKLLGTKAGYADRRVALDDVFKHVVLDGSLEEMRTVTTLLKKAGPEGRKAYAELQGQTIQQMKEMLTKGDQMSFKNLNTLINQLDNEGKLDYMYGKAGRNQITDLRDAIKDVVVKEPGAVNYPNTAGVVLRGLEILQKSPIKIPLTQTAAEFARTRQVKKQVEQSLKQPNQLAPPQNRIQINNMLPGRP